MAVILGLETSCDETAAAVVVAGEQVLANVISSQIARHAPYGGVIPELAAREHLSALRPMVDQALAKADLRLDQIEAVAVTAGPGLLASLLVGLAFAKGLAATLELPLIGVHHLLAHVYGALLAQPERRRDPAAWPMLALVVSGGHTLLLRLDADGTCKLLGQTLDDAAGEAFDKAARILHLPYPGGPELDRLARQGRTDAVALPRGLCGSGGTPLLPGNRYNFSYSGVKTALLYHLRRTGALPPPEAGTPEAAPTLTSAALADLAASYQEAVVDPLIKKLVWAARDCQARTLLVGGGVACNSRLRARLLTAAKRLSAPLLIAPPAYCTDNAAMIAGLADHHLRRGEVAGWDLDAIARPALPTRHPFGL